MTTALLVHARDRYLAKSIPLGGAIALPSVLYYESKLNPGSQGYQSTETPGVLNPHGAYGIPSLNGPRQKDLLDYATKHNLPVDNLDTQLDFVMTEIANSYPKSWAAVRSSASYKSIIPIIVDEYENPKDKQKEINGALVIAAALAALPLQQAPPAAVPQVPAPSVVTPPAPSLPTAPAARPPMLSTSAGRIAALTDTILVARQARVDELVSADPEIAGYDASLAAFGKIPAMIVPAALPKPPAEPGLNPVITPQRNSIKMNPQISATLRSILLALGGAAVSKGMIDQNTLVSLVGGAVSALSYGWSLWGHSTTGIIAAAASLPEVQKIVTTPAIADSPKFATNNTVVSH